MLTLKFFKLGKFQNIIQFLSISKKSKHHHSCKKVFSLGNINQYVTATKPELIFRKTTKYCTCKNSPMNLNKFQRFQYHSAQNFFSGTASAVYEIENNVKHLLQASSFSSFPPGQSALRSQSIEGPSTQGTPSP